MPTLMEDGGETTSVDYGFNVLGATAESFPIDAGEHDSLLIRLSLRRGASVHFTLRLPYKSSSPGGVVC